MRPRSGGICDVFPGGSEYSGHREKRLFCPGLNLINNIMTTNIVTARQVPKPACAYRVQHAGSEHCKSVGQSGGFCWTGENRGCRTSPRFHARWPFREPDSLFQSVLPLKQAEHAAAQRRTVRDKRKKRVFSAQRQLEKALSGRLRG